MMDPAVKTALASCVLLAGVCAALLFRRDPAGSPPTIPAAAEQLHIPPRAASSLPPKKTGPSAPNQRPATVATPLDRREPPPTLADSYPQGASMDAAMPVSTPADDATRVHRIVDGDALAALAERYLGSAVRAQEIFEANRDVLASPELLPIAADLKIPPRNRRPAPPAALPGGVSPSRPLVHVP